jgi:hypothetical protein
LRLADEYYDDALSGGVVGAFVLALVVWGLFVQKRRRIPSGASEDV